MILRPELSIIKDCKIAATAKIMPFVNLYDSSIGEDCFIGPFVEIGGASIGKRTKISSHTYICPGVTIGSDCFVAHNVSFTNDLFSDIPKYYWIDDLRSQWKMRETTIGNSVRIGSGAVILPVKIGDHAIVGAGAVVTRDVAEWATVHGVPAK